MKIQTPYILHAGGGSFDPEFTFLKKDGKTLTTGSIERLRNNWDQVVAIIHEEYLLDFKNTVIGIYKDEKAVFYN